MQIALLFIAIVGLCSTLWMLLRQRRQTQAPIVPGPFFGSITSSIAYALPIREKSKTDLVKDLVRGGYLHESALINFLSKRNVMAFAWVIACIAIDAFELITPTPKVVGIAMAVLVMIYGTPRIWLSMHSAQRAKRISHDLPDALDLLAMMMSGGMTINDSLNHVIGEFDPSHPALASELRITARHAKTGSLDKALVAFAERMDLPEVTALTAMLRGGHRVGGSLVHSLRSFSDGLRYEREQKAKERGNTASVKLLLPVIFCLAPPLYIMLLGPAFLNMKDFIEKENRPGGALSPAVQASELGTQEAISARVDTFTQNR